MNRLVDKDFRHDEWLLSGLPDDDEDIELDDDHGDDIDSDRRTEMIKGV